MSKMKTDKNQNLINDLKDVIEAWASEHFAPSGWDNKQNYIDDLEAMADMGNDMIVTDCYEDIANAYVEEIGSEQLEEIINEVLAKEAKYWSSVMDDDDFDDEYDEEYDEEY